MTGPDSMMLVHSALALPVGAALGVVHFRSLFRVTHLLLAGRLWGVALQCARFAFLGGTLWAIAQWGPLPLLCALAGVLLGRAHVLRSVS